MLRRWRSALGLAGACLVCASAFAQPAPVARSTTPVQEQGPGWATLTPVQRDALAPLRAEWAGIDAPRKQKWIEITSRFPSMSADERARVQVRMAEWARMSPADRGRARLQFQETRQLSPQDRQTRWDAYSALPPSQKEALAAKAAPQAAKPVGAARMEPRPQPDAAKRNVVTASPTPVQPRSVAPTVIQAKPGATTTLVSRPPTPPAHHQTGLPKIAATKGFVDPSTLLPKRGPQGAAVAAAPAASGANTRQ